MREPRDQGDTRVRVSSGNVFADLGLDEPEEEHAKATLAMRIIRLIRERGWSQAQAAAALGIDQPKISKIVRLRLDPFSTERLLHYLTLLGQDVEIVVRPKPTGEPRATLRVAVLDDAPAAD